MSYPTPPLTSSPKHTTSFDAQAHEPYSTPSQTYHAQDPMLPQSQPYQPQYQHPYDAQHSSQNQPATSQYYIQPYQPPFEAPNQTPHETYSQSYQQPYQPPKSTAQDSYHHSYSAPASPTHTQPAATSPKPHRRRSSPIPSLLSHSGPRATSPLIRPSSTGSSRRQRSPGNPNYYSNSPVPYSHSPKPTPYNLNRPQPRPGFFKRCLNKIKSWLASFARWTKRNPIKAGLLTFFPVMTIAGVAKVVRGIGKGLGFIEQKDDRPKIDRGGSSRNVEGEGKRNVRWQEHDDVIEDDSWGWGLDSFKGFGGSKGGPMDGVLKMMQLFV